MVEEKKSIDNVEFPGVKSPESECEEKWIKKAAQKRRVIVTSCIVACVLIAVVSVVTLLKLQNVCGGALVAVNLKEGDVLTYQVNQTFQINGTNNQKETISSTVGLKVVNKTSEIYLFLVKIISISKSETDQPKIVPVTTYFHVRHYRKETSSNESESGPFDVYGDPKTDPEYVRYIHGVLYQLLPSVKRDLYQEIDGKKTDNKDIPENSHLFPGPVRMHRKANTTQPDHVSIKSHFNRSDFVNSSSDVDVDMNYANYASLNKTNGMMSESDVTLYEQLKFGKPMKTKDGHDVTMMNINVHSHVTRIEIEGFFKQKEIDAVEIHLFAKLEIPVSDDKIKVFDTSMTTSTPSTTFSNDDRVSTQPSTVRGRKRREMDTAPKRRVRRNAVVSPVFDQMRRLGAMMTAPDIHKTYKLFEEKVIGVNVKAQAWQSLQNRLDDRFKFGVGLELAIGSKFFEVYKKEFDSEDLENLLDKEISKTFGVTVPVCMTVYIVELCVDFSLEVSFSIRFRLIPEKTALVPLQFAAEVIPSSSAIVSVEAYASVWVARGGVYVDGTLVRATLPLLISYNRAANQTEDWCLTNGLELTALEVEAGLFYQLKICSVSWHGWWPVVSCDWGSRNIVLRFGKSSAINKHYNLLEQCF